MKQIPLHSLHVELGAKFGPFAGYDMPLFYGAGVLKEHLHTRGHAGLFDISHMRHVDVTGADAARLVSRLCPYDATAQENGAGRYTFFLNKNAGIIDDLIVTRLGADRFRIVCNAGCADKDIEHLRAHANGFDVKIEPLQRVFLALQGPEAEAVLASAGLDAAHLAFMHAMETPDGWFISRSGYTGEDGFEIGLPADEAEQLARKLTDDPRVEWIGLAARDSLRLEAGLCLYGQDLDEETDPVSASLTWAIAKSLRSGGPYRGADALAATFASGPIQKRVGLKAEGRMPVRGGDLFAEDGAPAGRITSGGFGPSVNHPVAMGYVTSALAVPGNRVFTDVRGKQVPLDIVKLPFTPKRSNKG